MNNICIAPKCEMTEFNNLFIELTQKNCNKRCKHCYIKFPLAKNVKDFISQDKIKEALKDTLDENLQCIYLTGAEPMTHPDFNSILRLCLKRTNVCICTNGSFINEKKIRFLKKIEDESDYELIVMLSIDHYDEAKNDDIRGRGSYREVLCAIRNLIKYNFNPILCVTDVYNEGEENLLEGFKSVLKHINFIAKDNNFKINSLCTKNTFESVQVNNSADCKFGRILSNNGVYCCPFLSNDHRGWSGGTFKDFSHKNNLETEFCLTCINNQHTLFSIDFNLFEN